jgi:hypothetical protein
LEGRLLWKFSHNWHYNDVHEREELYMECYDLLYEVLPCGTERLGGETCGT